MKLKKIDLTPGDQQTPASRRPSDFDDFVGQESIKTILRAAITSSQTKHHTLGHILMSGPSGHGKTTLAQIIASKMGKQIKIITGYAISKPAEMISILNTLQEGDILFIDEIHRLRPVIEEMLYIAMEDFALDMVMPDGGNVRIPVNAFTLIGATTKLESLSDPFKNRFVYKFHFSDYTTGEKHHIIQRYLNIYHINTTSDIIDAIERKVESIPREIHNFCIKIRDFLIAYGHEDMLLNEPTRKTFEQRVQVHDGGLTPLHLKYLELLEQSDQPISLKTLSLQLGIDEQSVEDDVEKLLIKLGKIQKTSRGRVLV